VRGLIFEPLPRLAIVAPAVNAELEWLFLGRLGGLAGLGGRREKREGRGLSQRLR
jgi:hypothetical protein